MCRGADCSVSSWLRRMRILCRFISSEVHYMLEWIDSLFRHASDVHLTPGMPGRPVLGSHVGFLSIVSQDLSSESAFRQYVDAVADDSCSPACTTCIGPAPTDCLACAPPRANLNGACVGFDPTTGICETGLSGLTGVFVVDNAKARCDGKFCTRHTLH